MSRISFIVSGVIFTILLTLLIVILANIQVFNPSMQWPIIIVCFIVAVALTALVLIVLFFFAIFGVGRFFKEI